MKQMKRLLSFLLMLALVLGVVPAPVFASAGSEEAAEIVVSFEIYDAQTDTVALLMVPTAVEIQEGDNGKTIAERLLGAENVDITASSGWMNSFTIDGVEYSPETMSMSNGSWLVYRNNSQDSVGPVEYVPGDGDVYRFILTTYDTVTYEMPTLANDMDALYWAMAKSGADLTSAYQLVMSEAPSQAAIDALAASLSTPGGKHYVIIDQRTVQVDTTGYPYLYTETLSADKKSAEAGETVTVTVTAPAGLTVKEGTLKANGTPLTKVNSTTYTFEMPDAHVSVTAEFEADDSTKLQTAEFFLDEDGRVSVPMDPEFDKDTYEYKVDVLDQAIEDGDLYFRATFAEGATAEWQYYMDAYGYSFYTPGPEVTSGEIYGHSQSSMLYPGMTNGLKHRLDLTSSAGLVTTYYFTTTLYPTLLSIDIDGEELAEFDFDEFEYEIELPAGTTEITITPEPYNDENYVYIDGDDEDAAGEDVTVSVTDGQEISVVVDDDNGTTLEYILRIKIEEAGTPKLSELAFKFGTAATATVYEMEPEFDPEVREYTVYVPDYTANVYGYATLAEGSEGAIVASYANASSGAAVEKTLNSGGAGVSLLNLAKSSSLDPLSDVVISIGGTDAYTVHVRRQATLNSGTNGFSLKVAGANAVLTPAYNRTVYEYATNQPADAVFTLSAKPTVTAAALSLNGAALEAGTATEISPVWTDHGYEMVLTVAKEGAKSGIYTVHVTEIPVSLTITTPPGKTLYRTGDDFDPSGMVVTVTYADNDTAVIPISDLTITPSTGLTLADTEITVSYHGASAVQAISFEAPFEGAGTEEDPFRIRTAEDINKLDAYVEGGESFAGFYLEVMNDIALDADFNGVGTNAGRSGQASANADCRAFSGNFDGGGHTLTVAEGGRAIFDFVRYATISDLSIYGAQIDDYALISTYIADSGVSSVAVIDNVTIKSGTKTLYSGFIGGYASGSNVVTIKNSTVEEGVVIGYTKDKDWIGSFAGEFNGTITDCVSDAEVYGANFVGGIVADKGQTMGTFEISGCSFGGSVTATGNYAGGIVGAGYGGTGWGMNSGWSTPGVRIRNCMFTGSVKGDKAVGGILGGEGAQAQAWGNQPAYPTYIENNTSKGKVSGNAFVGGDIGYILGLNRYDYITGNTYNPLYASAGIGGIGGVDTTGHEAGFAEDGTFYFSTLVDAEHTLAQIRDTIPGTALTNVVTVPTLGSAGYKAQWKGDHYRDDDPLGEDAYELCRPLDIIKVTLTNAGSIEIANEPIEAEDLNTDGKVSVDEVFVAVHDARYPGGAEAGYATADHGYLAITKLWGVENGGGYGYYNNNTSLYSLDDEIKAGDHFVAYVYKDTQNWSDAYCYFDKFEYEAEDKLTVTFTACAYDEEWNLVHVPVHGAELTLYTAQMGAVDPSAYRIEDNGDGSYTIFFYEAGEYKLVGQDDVEPLVPAVADVKANSAVETTELTVVNITNMFKGVKAHLEETADGEKTLVFSLSGSGYHYLYPGTYEEAVENDEHRENWLSGYQNAEGKWEFRMPVSGEGIFPVTAISQSYLDKYEQGLNPLARAFYPRQIVLDLTENTATFDDYHTTKELEVENNVRMFKVNAAELLTVGGPNSNGYSSTLILTMGSTSFDKAFVGTAEEAAAAAETIAIGEDLKAEIKVMWINTIGDPSSIESLIGEQFVMSFHSVNKDLWYERLFTIKEDEGKLIIDPVAEIEVNVTMVNAGDIVVADEPIKAADKDYDGKISADEVFIALHNAKYPGGAAAGYATADYGYLAITKLWGVENGGGYGYCNNNASLYSLGDEIKDGDHFVAFIYKDLETWSDTYAFFDKFEYEAEGTLTVTLSTNGYDSEWNPVTEAHPGAELTLWTADMEAVSASSYSVKDNGDGTYTIRFYETGDFMLVGRDDEANLVPALAKVTVKSVAEEEDITVIVPFEGYPVEYSVKGSTVRVTGELACKVGYLDAYGRYMAITAIPVEGTEDTYMFTAPKSVTEVVLVIKGDTDLNGSIRNSDAIKIKAFLAETGELSAMQQFAADVDGNGEVRNSDAIKIKAFLAETGTIDW